MDEEKRRIVCAAIRLSDGLIVTGARHYDEVMVKQLEAANRFEPVYGDDQGFIDQWGNYLTRQEAYAIAKRRDQLKGEGAPHVNGCLFSEDLY